MKYDYVIVGGGTAGVVTAYRLAEKKAGKILLIEAGISDEKREDVLQLKQWSTLLEGDLDYDFTIAPQKNGNSNMRHSRAKVMGGCSSHNSAIAFQAPGHDFEVWTKLGVENWTPQQVRPFYDKVLEKVNLEKSNSANACGKAMIEASEQFGIPAQDFEQGNYHQSAGWFSLNKKGGLRYSSSVAYLHPYDQIPEDLTIITETFATKLLIDEHKRVTGVETNKGTFEAAQEVILSGGAFHTPHLLMLSGIGPADHLKAMDIPVIQDLAGVGEHLLDHPEGVIMWESALPVPEATAQKYEIGIFCKTRENLPISDLMFHFGTEAFDMHTVPAGYPTAEQAFSLTPNVMQARSEGIVRLKSANPEDAPLIDPKYFTDPEGYDIKVMVEGIKIARKIAEQPALRPWIKQELAPGPEVQTDEEIRAYIYKTHNTVYHPAGTCKMGSEEDEKAVTNSSLKVKGIQNLRIADASVFPTITSINPCITCMMIGERCADFILLDK
ncbi:GMC family oxidoreductase [Catalinimonas niigatensis]|uniref:GMC family oxidoreductase n=1 Tax=Catalinimonas niigatensis TaxID=1397264 RepID=UPI00266514C2|nr:GMC oxidoreductase [Catalinimonas niigatensis]WPP51995.1 GMC family oxidoreductase N-terminal domain-containing protein [Catalinimonas niigatensis]